MGNNGDSKPYVARNEQLWKEKYEEAKAFHKKHGHLHVPTIHRGNRSLFQWISYQRKQYQLGKLSKEKQSKLNEIGMVWETGFRKHNKKKR